MSDGMTEAFRSPEGDDVGYKFGGIDTCLRNTCQEQPIENIIEQPKHYTSHPSGIECIQVTEHMNFNLGNVVKYIWRNGLKDENPSIQDLRKAAWYLNREIERLSR